MTADSLATPLIIAGGAVFIAFAQLARRRAVAARGASVRTAGGLPQLLPYFFWVPYLVVALRPGPNIAMPELIALAGIVLSVAGVVFALWAITTLGRHYDLLLEVHTGHELVRDGPYRVVRHPVYTGLGLHFIGACLATGNVLLIVGTLAITLPGFYVRARAEEQLLREQFGAEYDAYAARVRMLVPLP